MAVMNAQASQQQMTVYTQQVDTEKRVSGERLTMIKTLEDQQLSLVTDLSDMKHHVSLVRQFILLLLPRIFALSEDFCPAMWSRINELENEFIANTEDIIRSIKFLIYLKLKYCSVYNATFGINQSFNKILAVGSSAQRTREPGSYHRQAER